MKVCAIVPTLAGKDRQYAELCVESLLATTDWPILISENGAPFINDYPELWKTDMRIGLLHDPRQGQCQAVNQAVAVIPPDTDYIFVTNADMYYSPGWNKHLEFEHPCFSPNLIEPTDNNGSAPPFLKFNGGLTLEAFNRQFTDNMVQDLVDSGIAPREETGFNLPFFIKTDLWKLIGGYDESYDPWGSNSDTDLQTKIELAGVQPIRLRDVLVWHFSNKSGTFGSENQEYWWRNWNYYKDKWGFTRDDEPIPDTWYARDMVNQAKNHYHPDWEGNYE